uniref:Uncharacterized protein LOC108950347 n=1 Tax=Phallusia mammillata TaxID=59560 RepID=A0A6F9DJU3_9ASCI|nr:uncharacterized protein LOC108950347 [Phallusia mammillata]
MQIRKMENDLANIHRQAHFSKYAHNLKNHKRAVARNFIRKINWLYEKQRPQRACVFYFPGSSSRHKKNRRDTQRYRKRKAYKIRENIVQQASQVILNKSAFNLDDNDKILLMKGPNFVATPNWATAVETNEWLNTQAHIRRVEWAHVFENSEAEYVALPRKLTVPRHSRPDKSQLDDVTIAYVEGVMAKMRNLKEEVIQRYKKKNNLSVDLRKSLHKLYTMVRDKKIVICRSDKDGKIIIINYSDYDKIMKRELAQFVELDMTPERLGQHLDKVRKTCDKYMMVLHAEGAITEKLLYGTVGIKFQNNRYHHTHGCLSKVFCNNNTAYAYPLFKTHKLQPALLSSIDAADIQIRLLQSAGNITTSRVTAFLELVLQPISVAYCRSSVDEYCRDTRDYLMQLDQWKRAHDSQMCSNRPLFLVTADVTKMYANLRRDIVAEALLDATTTQSTLSENACQSLMQLVMYCLENVITQYQQAFFQQSEGIVTGDNHSVSVANITAHYIIKQEVGAVGETELFRRYIDDIVWLSYGKTRTLAVERAIRDRFALNNLEITFRRISTIQDGACLEFLDVLHIIDKTARCGFYTTNYVKPTAKGRLFLNGTSHHPPWIFRGIVFGECIRLRRLNEMHDLYRSSLCDLEAKCRRSCFPFKVYSAIITAAAQWKERFAPPTSRLRNEKRIVWATSFTNILRLTDRERQLKPSACVVYKRPFTIGAALMRYKVLAHETEDNKTGSYPCGKCALCGHHGKSKSMVFPVTDLRSQQRLFHLRQHLSCRNYGIYVATCLVCEEQYVGQTKNKFSTRWNSHRAVWRTSDISVGGDRAALLQHYHNKHFRLFQKKLGIAQCYNVVFVEEPRTENLDVCENKWLILTGATINVQAMVLPAVR